MVSLGSTVFLGWHKNCGGLVHRVFVSNLLGTDIMCDKCTSRRSGGTLGDNKITDDPYDSSVESLIADEIKQAIGKHLNKF